MNHHDIVERVFAKLGDEKQLLEYHDCVFKMLGIVIDFISAEGVSLKLSKGRHFNPLCDCLRRSEAGNRLCKQQDGEAAENARITGKVQIYTCYAGLVDIVVPLFTGSGVYLGCLTSGQFHIKDNPRPDLSSFEKLAGETGLDAEQLFCRSSNTVELTSTQMEGLIGYLQLMGELVVSTHHNLMYMESVNTPDKIQLIRNFIHENYSKPLTVESVAKKFFFTANYFSRIFHQTLGVGFNAYLSCFRVDKAKEMLRETELSVGEIAFLCGFGSISQFNRVFRSINGYAPRDFRKNIREDIQRGGSNAGKPASLRRF